MIKNIKTFRVVALLMSLLLVFMGCGKDTSNVQENSETDAVVVDEAVVDEATAEVEPEEEVVTETPDVADLTFAIWGNDKHKTMYDGLIVEFNKIYPDINVEIQLIPFGDYQTKLAITYAGGEAPDVFWLADSMISSFKESGQLADVSSMFEDPAYDVDDISKGTLDFITDADGKTYGIPFSTPPLGLFYNKNMFEAAGIMNPMEHFKAGTWTFEEMRKAAIALTDKANNVYGIKYGGGSSSWYYDTIDFVWGYGGEIFDGNNFTMDSEESIKGVQFYYDLIFTDQASPLPDDSGNIDFYAGMAAMNASTLANLSKASDVEAFEIGYAPLPKGPASETIRSGYAVYAMFEEPDSQKFNAKLKLLKFLTTKESMMVTSQYFVAPRKSVIGSDAYLEKFDEKFREDIKTTVVERFDLLRIPYAPKAYSVVNPIVASYFDRIYLQMLSVEEAITLMKPEVQSAIDNFDE